MTSAIASQGPSTEVCSEKHASHRSLLALVFAVLGLLAWGGPQAGAVSDSEELATFGTYGTGAGETNFPDKLATDPTSGHVYAAETGNSRISEFTAWGAFVKAFGWDVAPGPVNEQQEVRVRASAGQFRLSFGGSTTTDLAFDAPGSGAGSVEAALQALPSIGGVGAEVAVSAVPGTPNGVTPYVYVIVFRGSLAATNVAQITAADGSAPLSGGSPSTILEARTRAEGTAGGSGLESCTEESGCRAGSPGEEAGQLRPDSHCVGHDRRHRRQCVREKRREGPEIRLRRELPARVRRRDRHRRRHRDRQPHERIDPSQLRRHHQPLL